MNALRIWLVRKLIELNERYIFDRKLLKYYKNNLTKNPKMILDVGGNIGQSIDLFLKLNKECKIISFEPNIKLYNKLVKKYKNLPNVEIYKYGVSDTTGERTFYENVFHATSTFEELDMKSKYLETKASILGVKKEKVVKKSYTVKTISLSDFIEKNKIDSIDILKIDTEGHEYACLKGLFSKKLNCNIDNIQLELHNDDMYLKKDIEEEILKILDDKNFEVDVKIKHGFGDFHDVIFRPRVSKE